MFSKYKNKIFKEPTKKIIKSKIRILTNEDYLDHNMIVQGNNINDLMNLKNFKNENLLIKIKSPNDEKPGKIISFNGNENIENKKFPISSNKSQSITNSNLNTNPSTVHISDSLTQNFQIKNDNFLSASKEKSVANVK